MKNVLIGITSSIASYKIYELIRLYKKTNYNVKVVLTPNALNFVSPLVLETLTNNKTYFEQFSKREEVEHINLADWADVFLVAPLSANSLSKFALGLCDNLLSSIFCAYLGSKKPILCAPAMNENMYNNPLIQGNLNILKTHGVDIIEPETGFLACGYEGKGRLADIEKIYQNSLRLLYQNKKNNQKRVVVTLGGTKEHIDSVRYITNSSSGKMGFCLCDWAYYLGYDVCAVSTVEKNKPYPVKVVSSADEMYNVLKNTDFDYLFMASAVADFKAKQVETNKIQKEKMEDDTFNLELIKNIDIVSSLAKNKKENQIITGFCLADCDIINCAKNKLKNKNLDFIIANDVKTALNTDKNKVTIIDKSDKIIDIDLDFKENVARKILEVICD